MLLTDETAEYFIGPLWAQPYEKESAEHNTKHKHVNSENRQGDKKQARQQNNATKTRKNPSNTGEIPYDTAQTCDGRLRPFITRSDCELLIFIFRSEKKMGLLMQSNFPKSKGIKSDLRIRWPKSSEFGPKSDESTHRIIKSKNGIGP